MTRSDIFHFRSIWQFLQKNNCVTSDPDAIQDMDGMWYRKATILAAISYAQDGGQKHLESPAVFPLSKSDCVAMVKQTVLEYYGDDLDQLKSLDIQTLQNTMPVYFRKKITREALAQLATGCQESVKVPTSEKKFIFRNVELRAPPSNEAHSLQLKKLNVDLDTNYTLDDVNWLRKIGRFRMYF